MSKTRMVQDLGGRGGWTIATVGVGDAYSAQNKGKAGEQRQCARKAVGAEVEVLLNGQVGAVPGHSLW